MAMPSLGTKTLPATAWHALHWHFWDGLQHPLGNVASVSILVIFLLRFLLLLLQAA